MSRTVIACSRSPRRAPAFVSVLALLVLATVASADGLKPAGDIGPVVGDVLEAAALHQVNEVSKRRRLTTFFVNEQSPFYGVQVNYVNVGRGNLTFLNRDLVRLDQIPIVFGRVYDSRGGASDFGPGWKLAVAETVRVDGETLTYVDASGSEYRLERDGARIRSPYPHLTGIEAGRAAEGRIEVQVAGLVKRFRNIAGTYYLEQVRDGIGNTLDLRHEGDKVAAIRTARGRYVEIRRDGTGRITGARDDAGRQVTYEYNEAGQLAVFNDVGGGRWRMSYDDQSLLTRVIDPRDFPALTATHDTNGRAREVNVLYDSMSFAYSEASTTVTSALQQLAVFWQDASGLTRSAQDFAGGITELIFDTELRPVELRFNGGLAAELSYLDGRLSTVRSMLGYRPATTVFGYDDRGRLTSAEKDGIVIAAYTYDPRGRFVTALDWGGVRSYEYGPGTRPRQVTVDDVTVALRANDLGLLTGFDVGGERVQMAYDAQDRVRGIRFLLDGRVYENRYEYGRFGLRTEGTYVPDDDVELTVGFGYDSIGNLTGLAWEGPEGATTQTYTLGDRNQLLMLTSTLGESLRFDYDAAGRPVRATQDGQEAIFDYDALGRLSGASLNGEQLLESDYGPMDVDAATEADGQTSVTTISAPIGSGIFGSLESIAYARVAGSPFGPIRFNAPMGRFVLAEYLVSAPDAVLLASLKHRALPLSAQGHHGYGAGPERVSPGPMGYDKPSNGLFLPAEFSSLNCYYCLPGVFPSASTLYSATSMTTSPSTGLVGQSVNINVNASGGPWWCMYTVPNNPYAYGYGFWQHAVDFGDGTGSIYSGASFALSTSHTYSTPGTKTIRDVMGCGCVFGAYAALSAIGLRQQSVPVCDPGSGYNDNVNRFWGPRSTTFRQQHAFTDLGNGVFSFSAKVWTEQTDIESNIAASFGRWNMAEVTPCGTYGIVAAMSWEPR